MTAVLDSTAGPEQVRASHRAFVDEVVLPYATEFDLSAQLPATVLREVSLRGYWGAVLDRDPAGPDTCMARFGVLHEEIGRGCSSLRSLLTVHSMVLYALDRWGGDAARARWLEPLRSGEALASFCLTERDAGSDISRIASSASPVPGGHRLDGLKKWVTGGRIADLLLVFARTARGPSAFLVEADAPGIRRHPIDGMLGTRASMLAEIALTGCEVGAEALLGAEGMGAMIATGSLDIGRYSVAAGCAGIIQSCLELSTHHASSRIQGGSRLADHQLVQRLVTDMATDVRAARGLCAEAGRLKDAGDPDTIGATCIAKYFASRAAMRAATDTVQLHGAEGCRDGHPAARLLRDAKIMEVIEGSTEIQQSLIAQSVLGRPGIRRAS